MVAHDLILITTFLSQLEQKPIFELGIFSFVGLFLCLFVETEGVHAASFVGVNI
jgi:hypothetical protein